MIVDVDQLAGEAAGEKAGDEQRDVPESLQAALAFREARGRQRLREHHHQRFEPQAVRGRFKQCFGAGEQRQDVDHVVLGVILHGQLLPAQRRLQAVAEVFRQARDGQDLRRFALVRHSSPRMRAPSRRTLSALPLQISHTRAGQIREPHPNLARCGYNLLLLRLRSLMKESSCVP